MLLLHSQTLGNLGQGGRKKECEGQRIGHLPFSLLSLYIKIYIKKTVDPYFNPGPLQHSLVITVSYSLIMLTPIITLPPYMWFMLLCSFDCSWCGFGDNIFMTLCNRLKFVAATSLCLTRRGTRIPIKYNENINKTQVLHIKGEAWM